MSNKHFLRTQCYAIPYNTILYYIIIHYNILFFIAVCYSSSLSMSANMVTCRTCRRQQRQVSQYKLAASRQLDADPQLSRQAALVITII